MLICILALYEFGVWGVVVVCMVVCVWVESVGVIFFLFSRRRKCKVLGNKKSPTTVYR